MPPTTRARVANPTNRAILELRFVFIGIIETARYASRCDRTPSSQVTSGVTGNKKESDYFLFAHPPRTSSFLENQKPSVLRKTMQITFRPAVTEDFDYCKRLYFTGMKTIIE